MPPTGEEKMKTFKLSTKRNESQKSHNPESETEIAIVKMLCDAGFHHKRIAALFDCNQGRIAEINKGQNGAHVNYKFEVSK